MTDKQCTCLATRPLGSTHMTPCPLAEDNVVPMYRNVETGRPVAVPEDIVTQAEREYRAYKLHCAGKTWREIAITEMYESAEAAAQAVKRYLDEGRAVVQDFSRAEVVAAHLGRLMMLRDAFWDEAVTEKKVTAATFLLNVEDRWVKAFGLDQPDAEDATVQTVVVPSEEYIAGLKKVTDGQDGLDEASAG